MSQSLPRIGKMQYQIMQALWQRGRASARQITEALARNQPSIAHSTVQIADPNLFQPSQAHYGL